MSEPEVTVAFLDVGQGDSHVITLPDLSSAIVVDCFRDSVTVDYLEKNGIKRLSYVFLTHTDSDHIGGAVVLLKNFLENFGQVDGIGYNHDTPRVVKGKRRIILQGLLDLARRHDLEVCSPRSGQSWTFQGVVVDVLHPDDLDAKEAELHCDTNNASIMLRITFAGQRILLAADVEGQGWQWVTERDTDIKANIFKFPHHGAWYDARGQQPSLDEVLRRVSPSLVVISVGTHNPHKHPHHNTLELLRSYSQLRFICTEATSKCHGSLKAARNKEACPCAGTVEVVIGSGQIEVIPDHASHSEVIKHFDTPQCKG
jgi:competence protein ComEC